MKYMMFVATDAEPDTDQTGMTPIETWVAETGARGQRIRGDRLATPDTATTVRVRNGELLVSDGPFAETKEAIIGYDLLECADLDEALRWHAPTRWRDWVGSNCDPSPMATRDVDNRCRGGGRGGRRGVLRQGRRDPHPPDG